MDTVREYFDEKNKAWLTGEVERLRQAAHVESSRSWWKRTGANIERKRQANQWRNGALLRAHTKVIVRQFVRDETKGITQANIDEHVTWVYRDNPSYSVESRLIRHQQRWRLADGLWRLEKDLESDELQRVPNLDTSDSESSVSDVPIPVSRFKTHLVSGAGVTPKRWQTYDRLRAMRYSELWWNSYNSAFPQLEDDCTNFISQCLFAGNVPMTESHSRAQGWWYRFSGGQKTENWSYSWTTSHALYLYLVNQVGAKIVSSARDLKVGDLIFYDWGGQGTFHHTTIVVDFDNRGDPLVNAHTDASWHRHYLYLDSRAWTARTRYVFLRMPHELG